MQLRNSKLFLSMIVGLLISLAVPAAADTRAEMERDAQNALQDLYRDTPTAKVLGDKAAAILVFPRITKGGFIIGGQYGEGTLLRDGKAAGFYNTAAASYGLQAGLQKFGYALFFMNESDLRYLENSDGWELGVGPTITVVDTGFARTLSTNTAREGMYAFFFSQKGLMAGVGLQGSKITKISPKG